MKKIITIICLLWAQLLTAQPANEYPNATAKVYKVNKSGEKKLRGICEANTLYKISESGKKEMAKITNKNTVCSPSTPPICTAIIVSADGFVTYAEANNLQNAKLIGKMVSGKIYSCFSKDETPELCGEYEGDIQQAAIIALVREVLSTEKPEPATTE